MSEQLGGEKLMIGTRRQVHLGTADHTSGGLTKKDLIKNRWGRIVSRSKYETAKKEQRLKKYGYTAKKGKFGAVKIRGFRKTKDRKK